MKRRAFLGGLAAAVSLPYLPSLADREYAGVAQAAEAAFPTRLLWVYAPNGFRMDLWRPAGSGEALVLGPTMAQLEDVREQLTVISGLANMSARGDRPGDHARGTGSFLTCMPCAYDHVENGISADQVAANALGDETALRSLEVGVEGGGSVGSCDSGYSCAYTQNISWSGPTTPMPKLTNPATVFNRLFAGTDAGRTAEERAARAVYRTSVLDVVKEQASALSSRVASDDRHRLDEYLTGVRELERRVASLGSCGPDREPPDEVTLETHADVMLDVLVAALQCDTTRFATFMLGRAGSNLTYDFLTGVSGAHHQVSHHQLLAENLDQLAVIDQWTVARFGRLVRRLQAVQEGSGTLLDHTIVALSSEISDGNRHNHDDLPVLLAGAGNGAVTPGRHLVRDGQPIADLWISMLQAAGVQTSTFGADGTGPLSGLS